MAKHMRISRHNRGLVGECLSCHGLVGNPTRNNIKCKRLGYIKSSERHLLFWREWALFSPIIKILKSQYLVD